VKNAAHQPAATVPPRRRIGKIVGLAVGFLIILAVAGVVAVSLHVGMQLVKPEPRPVLQTPQDYGLVFEDVAFSSRYDGAQLKGWWMPAQSGGTVLDSGETVIFAHGYRYNRAYDKIEALNLAKRLAEEGYNVLTFDFRRSGESEGELTTIGYLEKHDLLAAVDYVKSQRGASRVAVIGWSMGAVTAILAAAEAPEIEAVVADSPFSDLRDYLRQNLPIWTDLPSFPFTPVILFILPLVIGVDVDAVSPYQAVEKLADQRLLLIHTREDDTIPYTESQRIFQAAPADGAELWLPDEGGHTEAYLHYPQEYEEKVLRFLRGEQ